MKAILYIVGKNIDKFIAKNLITKLILGDLFYWGFVGSYSFDKQIQFSKLIKSIKHKNFRIFLNEEDAINYSLSTIN